MSVSSDQNCKKKEGISPTLAGRSDRRGARTRETAAAMVTGKEEDAETEQKRNGNRAICMVSPASTRPSTSSPSRERRQTAIKIRFFSSRDPSGDTTFSVRLPDSSIASWNRDLNFGVDCAIRASAPTRGRATQSFSDQTVILKPIPAYREHAKRRRRDLPISPSLSLAHRLPLDFSIFHACPADIPYTL